MPPNWTRKLTYEFTSLSSKCLRVADSILRFHTILCQWESRSWAEWMLAMSNSYSASRPDWSSYPTSTARFPVSHNMFSSKVSSLSVKWFYLFGVVNWQSTKGKVKCSRMRPCMSSWMLWSLKSLWLKPSIRLRFVRIQRLSIFRLIRSSLSFREQFSTGRSRISTRCFGKSWLVAIASYASPVSWTVIALNAIRVSKRATCFDCSLIEFAKCDISTFIPFAV